MSRKNSSRGNGRRPSRTSARQLRLALGRTPQPAHARRALVRARHARCARERERKTLATARPVRLHPTILVAPGLGLVACRPRGRALSPPSGCAMLYELAATPEAPAAYAGLTTQDIRARFSGHLSLARHRGRKNVLVERWIRARAEAGSLVIRVVALCPLDEAGNAERALIAELRARYGKSVLNLGEGGETAPLRALVSPEVAERRRVARRARQREAGYRLLQALHPHHRRHEPETLAALLTDLAAADPAVPMKAICRRHGVLESHLHGILAGRSNALVLDPGLLAAARAAQARRIALRAEADAEAAAAVGRVLQAYLRSPSGTSLANVARAHGMQVRRLQDAIRRRARGIPESLARAVRAHMAEGARLRGRTLGRRAGRIDRRQLRVLLTAYTRQGSRLTLSSIAARLGVTQSAVSHIVAGRKGSPLPRSLARACRARARAARLSALRGREKMG